MLCKGSVVWKGGRELCVMNVAGPDINKGEMLHIKVYCVSNKAQTYSWTEIEAKKDGRHWICSHRSAYRAHGMRDHCLMGNHTWWVSCFVGCGLCSQGRFVPCLPVINLLAAWGADVIVLHFYVAMQPFPAHVTIICVSLRVKAACALASNCAGAMLT